MERLLLLFALLLRLPPTSAAAAAATTATSAAATPSTMPPGRGLVLVLVLLALVKLVIFKLLLTLVVIIIVIIILCLACEPLHGMRDQLFTETDAHVVISFQLLLSVLELLIRHIEVFRTRNFGRIEEIEEAFARLRLGHSSRALSVLVALLLFLDLDRDVLALRPIDLGSLGLLQDRVIIAISHEVSFDQLRVGEEFIREKREFQAKSDPLLFGKSCSSNILEGLENNLILLGDVFADARTIPHCSEPKIRNSCPISSFCPIWLLFSRDYRRALCEGRSFQALILPLQCTKFLAKFGLQFLYLRVQLFKSLYTLLL
mmetsp:Transcript_17696/g.37339  ORF Transcript_17696/g.37339 Transcript_17696/m.37339 type:complete len:317 (-) Transcript_17696:339-1289(-)